MGFTADTEFTLGLKEGRINVHMAMAQRVEARCEHSAVDKDWPVMRDGVTELDPEGQCGIRGTQSALAITRHLKNVLILPDDLRDYGVLGAYNSQANRCEGKTGTDVIEGSPSVAF
jgi:hypothetical protein